MSPTSWPGRPRGRTGSPGCGRRWPARCCCTRRWPRWPSPSGASASPAATPACSAGTSVPVHSCRRGCSVCLSWPPIRSAGSRSQRSTGSASRRSWNTRRCSCTRHCCTPAHWPRSLSPPWRWRPDGRAPSTAAWRRRSFGGRWSALCCRPPLSPSGRGGPTSRWGGAGSGHGTPWRTAGCSPGSRC